MPDTLGTITVPDPVVTANVFPLSPPFPTTILHTPRIVEHLIENTSANQKITQRFYLGPGPRRWTFTLSLSLAQRNSLRTFWEARSGAYEAFLFDAPNPDQTTTQYTVTFENEPLSWQQLTNQIASAGITLVEFVTTGLTYTVSSTQTRFPSGSLATALVSQVQELIPLVKLTSKTSGYPVMYMSDRRCTVGGQLYLPRLVPQGWDGIEQSMDGDTDRASFKFGNSDRVMTSLSSATNLWQASIEFSLYHVGSQIKLDLWKGIVIDASSLDDKGINSHEFTLICADPLYELNILYPRPITRSCYKRFNDGSECLYSTQGSLNGSYPSASATECDKGFRTPNGCEAHHMNIYYGGILAEPQAVRVRDNSTGVWGFGRNVLTASSLIGDSVYEQALPEVFTDSDFPVQAKIIAGRDEGDFYAALGIICAGPVTLAANDFTSSPQVTPHLLDGQPPHGAISRPPQNSYGFRSAPGTDPANLTEYFSLGEGGAGPQTYADIHAAGVAFAEIRRGDEKGLQLSKVEEHAMECKVSQGLKCWTWSAPGSRNALAVSTNYIWVMVNILLRAKGVYNASSATQETYFDVASAIIAADVCDQSVTKLVGTGTETQFKIRAALMERRPLRDWLTDLSIPCLGYFTTIFGKLKFGIRSHSGAAESWTEGNIIANTLDLQLLKPQYNDLVSVFSNEDFQYVSDSQRIYDETHVSTYGRTEGQVNLLGVTNRSHALRITATRLREEIGGISAAQFRDARNPTFRTTILGLHAEPGMICSITHPYVPGGYMEFRVRRWRLNPDYSVDITGSWSVDEMYDLVVGPKPADVEASPIPVEVELVPADWSFNARTEGQGLLDFLDFNCATNAGSVLRGHFQIFYVDETRQHVTHMLNNLTDISTTFQYSGDPLVPGEWIQIDSEIMYVLDVTPTSSYNGVAAITRGEFGTTPVAHSAAGGTVASVSSLSSASFVVNSGLSCEIGDNIVRVTPAGESSIISYYSPSTGEMHAPLPLASLAAGNTLNFQRRVYKLSQRDEVVHFQPRFFKSSARLNFKHQVNMPFAGIAAIQGRLENSLGLVSDPFNRTFTTVFPRRLRTLGTTAYVFQAPVPAGNNLDFFEPVRVTQPQSLSLAFAEVLGREATQPITSPGSIGTVTLGALAFGGTVDVGGTPTAGNQIWVTIGTGLERIYLQIAPFTISNEADADEVAEALKDWLNGGEEFTAYFSATRSGSTVFIMDLAGVGGTVTSQVTAGGTITATSTGMTSQIGVLTGRRYAVSFRDSSGGYESELSPLSISTGPTGAAAQVVLRQVPVSGDARVDQRRVWAVPDGREEPYYLVATIGDNTTTEVVDTVAEASLSSQTPWPGGNQPALGGDLKVTVNRDGVAYCELRILSTSSLSSIVHGLALRPLAEENLLSVDVNNQAGEELSIRVTVQ